MEDRWEGWGKWYLAGINEEGYQQRNREKKDPYCYEWEEEMKMRKQTDWMPDHEIAIWDKMRQKKEEGGWWTCEHCGAEYMVKTSFLRLYCSHCLCRLTSHGKVLSEDDSFGPLIDPKSGGLQDELLE